MGFLHWLKRVCRCRLVIPDKAENSGSRSGSRKNTCKPRSRHVQCVHHVHSTQPTMATAQDVSPPQSQPQQSLDSDQLHQLEKLVVDYLSFQSSSKLQLQQDSLRASFGPAGKRRGSSLALGGRSVVFPDGYRLDIDPLDRDRDHLRPALNYNYLNASYGNSIAGTPQPALYLQGQPHGFHNHAHVPVMASTTCYPSQPPPPQFSACYAAHVSGHGQPPYPYNYNYMYPNTNAYGHGPMGMPVPVPPHMMMPMSMPMGYPQSPLQMYPPPPPPQQHHVHGTGSNPLQSTTTCGSGSCGTSTPHNNPQPPRMTSSSLPRLSIPAGQGGSELPLPQVQIQIQGAPASNASGNSIIFPPAATPVPATPSPPYHDLSHEQASGPGGGYNRPVVSHRGVGLGVVDSTSKQAQAAAAEPGKWYDEGDMPPGGVGGEGP